MEMNSTFGRGVSASAVVREQRKNASVKKVDLMTFMRLGDIEDLINVNLLTNSFTPV